MKKYLYKKINKDSPINFTHYWSNDGENYPDVGDIENFLSEHFTGIYDWVPINNVRLEKTNMGTLKIEVAATELADNSTFFIKLIDENASKEVPQYFYGEYITAVSDENYEVQSYQVSLQLDYWATFGCKMHKFMAAETMNEDFLFSRKMCNRFFQKSADKPYWIDYLLQPYLMQTGKYDFGLVRDITEGSLSLDTWLKMNGSSLAEYNTWIGDGKAIMGIIDCSHEKSPEKDQKNYTWDCPTVGSDFWFNVNVTEQNSSEKAFAIKNELFNSEGKYRYFIIKFGSNTVWNYTLDTSDPEYKAKEDAYNAAREQLKNYPDMRMMLDEVVLGGGKQCITTKKVFAQKGNTPRLTPTTDWIHLNGESLCIIPFPKGKWEEMYLYYLNSHDKGIVLGNGSILGMCINDIPPVILGAALRNFNNNNVTENHQQQTIGDKLAYRKGTKPGYPNGHGCPYDFVGLQLNGQWDWDDFVYFTPIKNLNDFDWIEWKRQSTQALSYSRARPKHLTNMSEGYFIIGTELDHDMNDADIWDDRDYGFDEKIPDPNFWDKWHPFLSTREHPSPLYGYAVYMHFKGGDTWNKDNWEFCGATTLSGYSGSTLGIFIPEKIDLSDGKGKLKDGYYRAGAPIIPPTTSTPGQWYFDYSNIYEGVQSEIVSHYFPTIFHDFSSIPVTIETKENLTNSRSSFFKKFQEILTPGYKANTIENEPILYGPGFWRWVYYVDGLNKLTLTADMISFKKLMDDANDWKINLNVAMTTNTNFRLDISDIKNDQYPFSKATVELITRDQITFPFTCEPFNNWYQTNMSTLDTSMNAKEIDNKWALKSIPYAQWNAALGGIGGGISTGAATGNVYAAALLAVAGGIAGGLGAIFAKRGIQASIEQANEKWANEWQGALRNMYNAPTTLNPSGFNSGSLIYSPNGIDKPSYDLFKTFTITDLARKEVWNDISMNGYFFRSQTPYRSYDNRKNFNVVNCNFDNKDSVVNIYLRGNMATISTLFSQQMYVDWFKAKCKSMIRLFHVEFKPTSLNEIIETNVEKSYDIPD